MKKIFALLLLAGCYHVHSVGQDIILPSTGTPIQYEAKKTIWFYFNGQNDFVGEAQQEFLRLCKGGTIHSTTSRLSTENSFLHWNYKYKISGVCVKSS